MPCPRPTKVFLFDIDGTLLMAGGCGRASFVQAWGDVFGPGQPFDAVDFVGRTDTGVFARGFADVKGRAPTAAETAKFFDAYHATLKRNVATAPRFRVLPGVPEVLGGLTAGRECIVGLVTGNTRDGAALKLSRAGLESFFACGGYGSDSPDRAELTAVAIERATALADGPVEITIIGDSLLDAAAARANGTRLVLVASGGTPAQMLATAEPDGLLDGFDDWETGLATLRGLRGGLRGDTTEIGRAAGVVRDGGVILYPTSTLYGIGGNGLDPAVAARVRNIKNRADTSFILLGADVESGLALGSDVPAAAIDLARRFWPGPLTLVLNAAAHVPEQVRGPDNTVAVRLDGHPFTRELAAAAGCPIISTSANISGERPAADWGDVDPRLVAASDIFIVDESGGPAIGMPSTIVAFRDDKPVVLRQGAISGELL